MTNNQDKEAILYKSLDNNKVECCLCAHRCLIHSGGRGICGVRENLEGKLYSLNYAKAIAVHLDPIEKKPLYHFLPGSQIFSISAAGCNFRCKFCQNWQISQITKGKKGRIVGEFLPLREVVKQACQHQVQSIAYTYTEPTIFMEYALDTARMAHKKGLKNVFVSNGFQTEETIDKMTGLIDAANIDLKSFSDKYYRKVCGAKLEPVLNSIKRMHQKNIWIEITTLVVPGQNDTTEELSQIAEFIAQIDQNIPWHISRFFPQYQMDNLAPTPVSTIKKAYEIGKKAGLNYVYVGNVNLEGREIDLPECNHTFCPNGHVTIKRQQYYVESSLDGNQCSECGAKLAGVFD